MKLVGVLILIMIAVFIIVMLMTFVFHSIIIIPIATTAGIAGNFQWGCHRPSVVFQTLNDLITVST